MPAFYKIDKERKIVMTTGAGKITKEDIWQHMDLLSKDPDFDRSFSQLQDFTHVTSIDIDAADVRAFAQRSIFSPESRRAIVVKSDLQFGLARMFQIHRELAGETGIRVFRTLEEGLDWVFPAEEVSEEPNGVLS
jgi:hypothetical protein